MSNHKLYKGDCLKVMDKIPDSSIDLVLVDLPYAQTRSEWDVIIPYELLWKQYIRIGKEHCTFVFTAKGQFMIDLILSNREWYRWEWVWAKGRAANFASANKRPLNCHEYVLVFCKKGAVYNPQKFKGEAYTINRPADIVEGTGVKRSKTICDGMRYPYSIIQVTGHSQKGLVHPTQKPLKLMEYLIKTHSNEGDTVLDNCMGSGTTGIAALTCGRNFIGIEQDEKYYKIAKARINSVPKNKLFL